MRWYNLLLIVCFVLLLSSIALAESNIKIVPIKNQVALGTDASFRLSVTNLERDIQKYSIYSMQNAQGWTVDPSPLSDKVFSLGPGQSKEITIAARTTAKLSPGIYYISLTVEGNLGDRSDQSLKVYLESEKPMTYLPSFEVIIDMDDRITPKSSVPITLFLRNKNGLDLSGTKVKIQSDIPAFVKEATVDLLPLGEKTVEFSIKPYEFQQPKEYHLFFVFEKEGEIIKVVEKKIEIISLLPDFTLNVVQDNVFFKQFYNLTIRNEGNVLNTQEVKVPISFLKWLFTSNAQMEKRGDQRYLIWEATLGPNEAVTVDFITNYRLIFYVLLMGLLFLIFYYAVKSPIVVVKKAMAVKSGESGTLSEIKVLLEVRNRSGKPLYDVSVIDTVPAIANVANVLEIGTLKPEKLVQAKKGTKVVWSLAELDAYEQRIIRYKIKAKLNIVGMFILPRVEVEFKKRGMKKKSKAYSNIFRLGN